MRRKINELTKKIQFHFANLLLTLRRGQFHQTLFAKQKDTATQHLTKKSPLISATIKTPNFKLKLLHLLPNLFTICQTLFAEKSFSSCVCKKAEKVY